MFAGENWFTRVRKKVSQPIVVKTKLVGNSFTFWPFIVLGRHRANMPEEILLAHEKTHFRRQRGKDLGLWIFRYAFSDSFRWKEEKPAIAAEVRKAQQLNKNINYDERINTYANNYNGMASREEVAAFIYNLRDTNPYMQPPIIRY